MFNSFKNEQNMIKMQQKILYVHILSIYSNANHIGTTFKAYNKSFIIFPQIKIFVKSGSSNMQNMQKFRSCCLYVSFPFHLYNLITFILNHN